MVCARFGVRCSVFSLYLVCCVCVLLFFASRHWFNYRFPIDYLFVTFVVPGKLVECMWTRVFGRRFMQLISCTDVQLKRAKLISCWRINGAEICMRLEPFLFSVFSEWWRNPRIHMTSTHWKIRCWSKWISLKYLFVCKWREIYAAFVGPMSLAANASILNVESQVYEAATLSLDKAALSSLHGSICKAAIHMLSSVRRQGESPSGDKVTSENDFTRLRSQQNILIDILYRISLPGPESLSLWLERKKWNRQWSEFDSTFVRHA